MGDDVAHMYDLAGSHFAQGDFVWKTATSTFYMALYNADLTPNQTTDEIYSTTNELATELGYTRGGAQMTISTPTIVGTDPDAYTKCSGSDVTWAGPCTFEGVKHAIIYKNSGTKYLVSFITWDTPKDADGGSFTVECPATGWVNLATP